MVPSMRKRRQVPLDLRGSDDFAILFLQGGASLQFAMLPQDLLRPRALCDYVETGVWSAKAISEAKAAGNLCRIAASSRDQDFCYVPAQAELESGRSGGVPAPDDEQYHLRHPSSRPYRTRMACPLSLTCPPICCRGPCPGKKPVLVLPMAARRRTRVWPD